MQEQDNPVFYDGEDNLYPTKTPPIQQYPPFQSPPYVPVIALVPGVVPPAGDVVNGPQAAAGAAVPMSATSTAVPMSATATGAAPQSDELPAWALPVGIILAALLLSALKR